MKLPIFQVDAFANGPFSGNPAAVVPLTQWIKSELMAAIAAENNLSETAFFVGRDSDYALRWFTPACEVDLCGHATLAAAHVLFRHVEPDLKKVRFSTRSGTLSVVRRDDGLAMDFPAQTAVEIGDSAELRRALDLGNPSALFKGVDLMVVVDSEAVVTNFRPNIAAIAELPYRGVIVTAPGNNVDFVSRFFAPRVGVDEDPVTGSAHCMLAPYWAQRLSKSHLVARQVARRGGEVRCAVEGNRVILTGRCQEYLEGVITIPD